MSDITTDPAYNTVAPGDFKSMIEVDRYNNRSTAFDKIISATHDHFWDPLDTKYIDFSVPFDIESDYIVDPEMSLDRIIADMAGLDEKKKIKLANMGTLWSLSAILHGEQGALSLSASLVDILKDPGAQEYATNQAREEARHVLGFSRYVQARWGKPCACGPALADLLDELVAAPEVYKKMESLLGEWADSLPEEKLPETIQILQLGARACHGSEVLQQKAAEAHQRWQAVAGQQSELPSVTRLRQQQPEQEMETLLSRPQLELAKLKEDQAEMARQLAEMRQVMQQQINALAQQLQLDELKQQVAALPGMLEKLISQSPVPAVSPAPAVTQKPPR